MYTLLPSCIYRADGVFIFEGEDNPDWREYLAWLQEGNEPAHPPSIPHAALAKQAIDQLRVERQPILGVLDGLQASYITKGDMPTATVIEVAKQALRDITKVDLSACETLAEMKVVVMTRYAQIASASPALKSAFSEATK